MTPAPTSVLSGSSSWRGGGVHRSRLLDQVPAIKEVQFSSAVNNSFSKSTSTMDVFLPHHPPQPFSYHNIPMAPPPPPRRLYTRSFTTPSHTTTAAPLAPPMRPPRRVTFDLPPEPGSPRGAAPWHEDELRSEHQQNSSTAAGMTSVCEVAGVASWLRTRRQGSKESYRTAKTSSSNNNNNGNGLSRRYSSAVFGPGFVQAYPPLVRRVSAVAAIESSYSTPKLPPTVGPPMGGGGGGAGSSSSVHPPSTPGGLALLRACREGDEEALQALVDGHAPGIRLQSGDVNCTDHTGRTPVSLVASSGSLTMMEALARFPAIDFNRADSEGNTPLHFAAQAGHVEVLNLLLSRCSGLEVDARNALGFTPLMKAALQGRTKCAKLLLFAGASPTLRDEGRGFRAEQWARFCGRHVCAEVIDKFSRHRLLERATAAHANSGRWGSEPELSGLPLGGGPGSREPAAPPPQHAPGSWLRSKLRRAFRSHADVPSSKAAKHQKHQHDEFAMLQPATSHSPGTPPPPQPPRVFIVPKVQVTPAPAPSAEPVVPSLESTSAESSNARPVVTPNARRKK